MDQNQQSQSPQIPEHISADELAYHNSLRQKNQELQAALQYWVNHLAEKYKLGDKDAITADGRIVRNVVTQNGETNM